MAYVYWSFARSADLPHNQKDNKDDSNHNYYSTNGCTSDRRCTARNIFCISYQQTNLTIISSVYNVCRNINEHISFLYSFYQQQQQQQQTVLSIVAVAVLHYCNDCIAAFFFFWQNGFEDSKPGWHPPGHVPLTLSQTSPCEQFPYIDMQCNP